uniref:Leucine-rich repeat and coiled-coil domain-containing protein 1 n=1 Tax=Tetraodon nigroviridis TaxID=99883 RepID=H3C8S7_TETNG
TSSCNLTQSNFYVKPLQFSFCIYLFLYYLLEVALSPAVTSLNLHCNRIPRIEGLGSAWPLRHLDLSSNRIAQIQGLSTLTSLRTLNLSCNLITKVEGLDALVNLSRLNLSYNQINNLTGLLYLHGHKHQLKHISLQGNHLDSIDHLLQCLQGLQSLREVTLSQYDSTNPVCRLSGYREMVMQSLPQISALDDLDRLGNPPHQGLVSPCDVPGLEDYVDLLLSSDTSHTEAVRGDVRLKNPHINNSNMRSHFLQSNAAEAVASAVKRHEHQSLQPICSTITHPADRGNEERIKKLEHRVSQLIKQAPADDTSSSCTHAVVRVRRAKRDTDRTSESEGDSGKENRRRSRIYKHPHSIASKVTFKETKDRGSDSDSENHKQKNSKAASGAQGKASGGRCVKAAEPPRRAPFRSKAPADVKTKSTENEETYRTIVEERDQEKGRRWKAEQAVKTLTEELKCLQTKFREEKDLQNVALNASERLKEQLLKERSESSDLHARIEALEGRCRSLSQQLEQACSKEEQHKSTLLRLEESVSQGEAIRSRQQAEESRRHQELENKAAALRRELDIQRFSVQQYKDKLQQMHELLVTREQEHRKQLGLRLQPGGADFLDAVAKEVASVEQRRAQREAELQEKVAEGRKQYAALEDEFRMALTIEAARFSEVKEACDRLTAELQDLKGSLLQSQQKERKAGSLVQELTTMVTEQKEISQLIRCKKEAVTALKRRLHSVEAEAKRERRLGLQLELLKKEKAQLLSKLTAQESVMDGLKEERKLWGQELAQQGVSLAQDRGRLEARIEVLGAELETQKKQNERNTDALKIKTKIVDDQTETIRKLKEALQERDDRNRKVREEVAQAQKKLQQQLEEQTAQQAELREQLDHLSLRKEELKQQLQDKHAELEEVKDAYRDSSKKWQEKADLLTQLESQVKRMKENFDAKERLLLEERQKATEAHKAAVEKLHSVDNAFRHQLESVSAAHQADLLQLEKQKQAQIDQANSKLIEVEEEMRQLLEETQSSKKIMEEKMKRLTNVLKDS